MCVVLWPTFPRGNILTRSPALGNPFLESPGIVTGYRMLVVNCALIGEIDEARAALAILKRLQPDVSLRWIAESVGFTRERERQDIIEGFRLAGLE